MKNRLTDLNDHLFAQLERLNDEDLTPEQIDQEVKRASAMTGVADQITKGIAARIQIARLYVDHGDVLTSDGSMIKVGRLTVGTGHADARLGYIPAADHYDNTGTAAAVVAAGEDQHGIWVAGGAHPKADLTDLKAAPVSSTVLFSVRLLADGNPRPSLARSTPALTTVGPV